MATINALGPTAINLLTLNPLPYIQAQVTSATTTEITLQLGNGLTASFTGLFALNDEPPTSPIFERIFDGTITGYEDNTLSLSEINVTRSEIVDAINDGATVADLFPLLLAENDTITGRSGNDQLGGYAGDDVILGQGGSDVISGDEGDDELRGGLRADSIRGGLGQDTINGGNGFDTLAGGQGADSITGGLGNDSLIGALGLDTLTGSAGADTFVIIGPNTGLDTITDFTPTADTLQVVGAAFGGGLTAGVLAANRFATGATATTAQVRFLYNDGSLFFDVDGSGATAAVQIATLTGAPTIQASNIVVI